MKTLIILLTLTLLAFTVPAAMMSADSSAYAQAAAPGDQVEKDSKIPSPPGVSPAQPGVNPPTMDAWCCPQCGATHSCKKQKPKNRFYRPMLAPHGHGDVTPGDESQDRAIRHRGKQVRGHRALREMKGPKHSGMYMHKMQGKKGHGMHKMQGMKGRTRGNAAMRLSHHAAELNLTEEQVAKLDELAYTTKLKIIDLRAAIEKERLEVKRLLESDTDDLAAIKQHLNAIAQSRADIQETGIANMIKAKSLLTDEQKKQLKERFPRMERVLD